MVKDGKTMMFSYENKKMVTVAFELPVTKDKFESCIVRYDAFGIKYICKIPTFFGMLNKSEEVGIPKSQLHEVFSCYIELCEPSKEGSWITKDARALAINVDKMAMILNIEEEQSKIQDALSKVIRSPGQPLSSFADGLRNLNSMHYYLSEMAKVSDVDKLITFVKDGDEAVSTTMIVEAALQKTLFTALRSLCSLEAQKNLNNIFKESNGLSDMAKSEAHQQVDRKYPIKTSHKLPATHIYVGSDVTSLNGDVAGAEFVGEFGDMKHSPSKNSSFRDRSPRYNDESKPKSEYQNRYSFRDRSRSNNQE